MTPMSDPPDAAALQTELAALREQTHAARAELARVQADLAAAQERLDSHPVQQLLVANEQLVLDAMRSREVADSTALLLVELTRSSELDALTSLPNRLLLIDRFSQGLTHARRNDGRLAVLFVDLDDFKQINDTLGHQAGDDVLRAVSHCLVGSVRQIDTVCRMGGDEFIVLLPEIAGAADAGLVAQKLAVGLAVMGEAPGALVKVSASIGISVYPDDGDTIEQLVDRADQAMYQSKRLGGGRYSFFSDQALG
jgi:diguanylate cyclase (GGDEF)-like protein